MTLLQTMKKQLMDAMKGGRVVEKEILKVAIGEIEVNEARGTVKTDADQIAIVRKLVKSNEETLASTTDPAQRTQLEAESAVLRVLLPQTLSADQIMSLLEPVRDAIRAAANDGQATGVAMKHLKTQSEPVNGKDVTEAVKKLRA